MPASTRKGETEVKPGFTAFGTQKVTIHLKGEHQQKFTELRQMLSPERPESFPLTEVLLYCLDETWKAKIGRKSKDGV